MASTAGGQHSYVVTGGTGFVGRHVVEELLSGGHRVVCLCRHATTTESTAGPNTEPCSAPNSAAIGELLGFSSGPVGRIDCDLSSAKEVERSLILADCDIVIHLAALYAWWAPDPSLFQCENVVGCRLTPSMSPRTTPHHPTLC
mmetsp:Transcript_22678/g.47086  ORF Transcript_22678/g.47086 Transcript_22678/m.47086 type:complete len:144 (+) Transcript_22678:15-446(+)